MLLSIFNNMLYAHEISPVAVLIYMKNVFLVFFDFFMWIRFTGNEYAQLTGVESKD